MAVSGFFGDRTIAAGPVVRVIARNFNLAIGSSITLTGDFWYEQALDQPELSLNAENVSVFIGDVGNQRGFQISNGSGEISISAGVIELVSLSATAELVNVPDIVFSAELSFSVTLEGADYVTRFTATDVNLTVDEDFSATGSLAVDHVFSAAPSSALLPP